MLTYYEVMTTDFGLLTTAADDWDAMASDFAKAERRYGDTVQKITMGVNWAGVSAGAAHTSFAATRYEYAAAQSQAKALARLLRTAHEQFTALKSKLDSARAEVVSAGMTVSEQGRVAFDYAKLTPTERSAYHHDPDGQASVRSAVAKWQQYLDDRVQAVSEVDQHVKAALEAAVVDSNRDAFGKGGDETLSGFNAHAEGDLAKVPIPRPKDADVKTETNGWHADGSVTVTGPDVGAKATGPKYGKEGSAKAYADIGHVTAEGSLSKGLFRLSGIADAYAGARASVNASISDKGLAGKAEASVGARGLAEGRVSYGYVEGYGRAEGFAGAEAQVSAGADLKGINAGAKVFAGAKASMATGAEVAGIGVGTTTEYWKGVGGEAKWTFGMGDDGKFHTGAKAGLGLGPGGALGLEITIDPAKVSTAAGDAADALGGMAHSATNTIGGWFD